MLEEYGDVLTLDQCMEILNIGRSLMFKLIREELPHIRVGRFIRVRKIDLIDYLEDNVL